MLLGAQVQPVTDDLLIVSGRGLLLGWVMVSSAAFDAQIRDGLNASGQFLDAAYGDGSTIPAEGVQRAWYGPQGLLFERGLFFTTDAAVDFGAIYYIPQTLIGSAIIVGYSGSDRNVQPYVDQRDVEQLFGRDD